MNVFLQFADDKVVVVDIDNLIIIVGIQIALNRITYGLVDVGSEVYAFKTYLPEFDSLLCNL